MVALGGIAAGAALLKVTGFVPTALSTRRFAAGGASGLWGPARGVRLSPSCGRNAKMPGRRPGIFAL